MNLSVKDALAYFSAAFGPYQYRQFRIIEFPRYEIFAQAFPNTIPYSEAIGFIARVRPDDPKDIDYPYYVTAHEAAHQWWAHQVIGGDVQGSSMLVESLAQYSALMVMKKKYGAGQDAALPLLRAEPLPRRPRVRAEEGAAAVARGEPALHPLRQGQPGVLRPAGLHRRGQAQPGDPHLPRRPRLQGPALPEQRGAGAAHPRGDAARAAVHGRGHVREDRRLRQPRGLGDDEAARRRQVGSDDEGRGQEARRRRARQGERRRPRRPDRHRRGRRQGRRDRGRAASASRARSRPSR